MFIRSFFADVLFPLDGVTADIEDFGFEEDVEHVFGGDEVGGCSGEFEVDIFLIGLLFGKGFDFVTHFFVHFE